MKKSLMTLSIILLGYLGYAYSTLPGVPEIHYIPREYKCENCSKGSLAISMGNIPQVGDNKLFSVGFGFGVIDKEKSVAIGVSGTEKTNKYVYKISAGINSEKNIGAGAGLNINFIDNGPKLSNLDDLSKLKDENDKLLADNQAIMQELNDIKDKMDDLKCADTREMLYVIDEYINDKYTMTNSQIQKLTEVVNEINGKYSDRIIDVVGHTDTNHNERYNLELGLNRANTVISKMIELGLKNPQNIRKVSSFGYNNKVSKDKLSSNRRVEIYVK